MSTIEKERMPSMEALATFVENLDILKTNATTDLTTSIAKVKVDKASRSSAFSKAKEFSGQSYQRNDLFKMNPEWVPSNRNEDVVLNSARDSRLRNRAVNSSYNLRQSLKQESHFDLRTMLKYRAASV